MAKTSHKVKKGSKRLRVVVLFVVLIVLLGWSGVLITENRRLNAALTASESKYAAFIAEHTTSDKNKFIESVESQEVHRFVNEERKKAGLTELTYMPTLETSACAKANDMIQKNYWAHNAPDGTEPWYFFQKAGVYYNKAGENLAYGFSNSMAVVGGWMNSPAHKANIVGDYTAEGICALNAPAYQNGKHVVVVQHFYK